MSHQRTVYVIDDDTDARRVLTAQLATMGVEAWPFSDGRDFLAMASHVAPGCILLTMEMPDCPGLDVMAALASREIEWPVICLSAARDLAVAVEAMKRGAVDFLEKPLPTETLTIALGLAAAALDQRLQAGEARRAAQERLSRLTPREEDVALALLGGQSNKLVAHQFGISVRTVEMHRAHIMAKLGVRSLAEAAILASQAGVMPEVALHADPSGNWRPVPRLQPLTFGKLSRSAY
ncbi:MAG: response regulator transcription factor [Alphaproteobacteria bacterium]|nr:MAG: response regulator transcription factor [Alphaproteobacteria bacterium]